MASDPATRRVIRAPFGTVRSRLTVLATAVVAAVLIATAFGLVATQRRVLTKAVDETLRQHADNIAPTVGQNVSLPNEGDREDSFSQLLDRGGRVIASSSNVAALDAVVGPRTPGSKEVIATVGGIALGDHQFRVLARSIRTTSGPVTLVVAKNLDDFNESIHVLISSLRLAIPGVVVMLALLMFWVTGRVLRPVESIRAEVADIQGTEVHRRVPVPDRDDEIARLARTMNAMLDRVESASERQNRFIADVSHELRSPLTRIRSHLELWIAHPELDEPAAYQSLLDDAGELQQLIDDLLFLAKSETRQNPTTNATVDLDDLVLVEANRLRERGRVGVDTTRVSAARVVGDPKQLARAIRNLADNAERHASRSVGFELRERGGRSELVVADDGPGVPESQHDAVFERFTRLDEARSRDEGGSGLGLAIVHDIATRHHGTIEIASRDGEGARFVLSIPTVD